MILCNSENTEKEINHKARCVEGERLAYYRSTAGVAFWEAHWKTYFSLNTYKRAEHGNLWQFEELFTTYLPNSGRILEAGCGLGQYVVVLKARGYDIEGLKWTKATVQAVRSIYPDLPIRQADVTSMNVPDRFYKAYISLRVVEHDKTGPQPFLSKAFRMIAPNSLALISVPYFIL